MGWLFGETVKKDANYHGCRYVWGKLHQKESDLVKLKKVFDAADRSGDGEVDIHEFLMYLDVERTKLIEHIFRQFDTDGGDSLSFKEFALALWTFASLDINGIGRFTYEIYKNDQRDGIDGTGITDFIEGVRSRRFEVLRCLHFTDTTRIMLWVVSLSSLRPMLRAGVREGERGWSRTGSQRAREN